MLPTLLFVLLLMTVLLVALVATMQQERDQR
jgi:hypothetical protein